MKLTAVLILEEIESSLTFWKNRLGFTVVAEVPEDSRIGFAMLARDGAEIMLQTLSSVAKDEPKFAPNNLDANVGIFIEVEDFAAALKQLDGYPITMPERTTFYGMREVGVLAPSGHAVIFAARI